MQDYGFNYAHQYFVPECIYQSYQLVYLMFSVMSILEHHELFPLIVITLQFSCIIISAVAVPVYLAYFILALIVYFRLH